MDMNVEDIDHLLNEIDINDDLDEQQQWKSIKCQTGIYILTSSPPFL